MTKQFKNLFPTIAGISAYIESKVGGTVFPSNNSTIKGVTFKWKKYDIKNRKMLELKYVVSYHELETMHEPMTIAKTIVDKVRKGEE